MSVSEAPVADGPVEGAESESFLRFLERHQKLLKLLEERSAVQAQLHDVRSRLEIAYGICVPRVAGEHSAYPVVGGSDVGAPGNLDDAQRGFSDHTERPKDEKDRGRHLLDTSVLLSEGDVSPPSGDGKKRPARAAVDGPVLSDAGARIAMDKLFLETKEDRARHEYLVYQKQRSKCVSVEGMECKKAGITKMAAKARVLVFALQKRVIHGLVCVSIMKKLVNPSRVLSHDDSSEEEKAHSST